MHSDLELKILFSTDCLCVGFNNISHQVSVPVGIGMITGLIKHLIEMLLHDVAFFELARPTLHIY